jgi:hypothetical protein
MSIFAEVYGNNESGFKLLIKDEKGSTLSTSELYQNNNIEHSFDGLQYKVINGEVMVTFKSLKDKFDGNAK